MRQSLGTVYVIISLFLLLLAGLLTKDILVVVVFAIGLVIVGIVALSLAKVVVVENYERLVAFHRGKVGVLGPGHVVLNPLITRWEIIDLREKTVIAPPLSCLTRENVSTKVQVAYSWVITDPVAFVTTAMNVEDALQATVMGTLRDTFGQLPLEDLSTRRDYLERYFSRTLGPGATRHWGVKITFVEIQEITLPPEVRSAMDKKKIAEEEKAIQLIRAERDKQLAIKKAEALETMQLVAQKIDDRTMQFHLHLQYLETLKELAQSSSTRFVLPMEFIGILKSLSNIGDQDQEDKRV